jgi:hypothetical protein
MNKSHFKVGRKVYINDGFGNEAYMYSMQMDDRYVTCTRDPHGKGDKMSFLYTSLTLRKPASQRECEKKYKHSEGVVKVFNDVEALLKLLTENPTYKDTIIELMRPYVGNSRFWEFVLHTAADKPELHNEIKELLTKSKE